MMKWGLAIETSSVYRCLSTQNMIIWEGSCNCLVDNNFMVAIAMGGILVVKYTEVVFEKCAQQCYGKETMATRTAAIDQIYDDIRDKILKNEYIPGSKLIENSLSVDYNCSNTGKFSPTSRHATLPRGRSSCSPTCGESVMRISEAGFR